MKSWPTYRGWQLTEGSHVGSHDDAAGRYYIEDPTARAVDRRGRGFASRKAAREYVDREIGDRDRAESIQ